MAQPKIRFSDVELEEFKTLINQKLVDANIDYSLLIGSLSHNDDHGTDDTGRAFNMMEDGSETLSREEVAQLAARQEKFIQSLNAALNRINNKTYGICRVKGTLIPKERLRLVPHATMSIDAKNEQKGE
jgi:RNA polymerase-binding transcription factor DksA